MSFFDIFRIYILWSQVVFILRDGAESCQCSHRHRQFSTSPIQEYFKLTLCSSGSLSEHLRFWGGGDMVSQKETFLGSLGFLVLQVRDPLLTNLSQISKICSISNPIQVNLVFTLTWHVKAVEWLKAFKDNFLFHDQDQTIPVA